MARSELLDPVHDWRQRPQVGVDGAQVVVGHAGVIGPRHLGVLPALGALERARGLIAEGAKLLEELILRPGADAGAGVGRDVGRVHQPHAVGHERRPARKFAAGQRRALIVHGRVAIAADRGVGQVAAVGHAVGRIGARLVGRRSGYRPHHEGQRERETAVGQGLRGYGRQRAEVDDDRLDVLTRHAPVARVRHQREERRAVAAHAGGDRAQQLAVGPLADPARSDVLRIEHEGLGAEPEALATFAFGAGDDRRAELRPVAIGVATPRSRRRSRPDTGRAPDAPAWPGCARPPAAAPRGTGCRAR